MVEGDFKRICIYSRVSTKEQIDGYSIADQVRELTSYAEVNNLQIVEIVKDEGYSESDLKRPGLLRVLDLAEAGAIDTVLATKRDRFFRSRYRRLSYDQDLADLGVKLVALNDTDHKIADGVLDDYAELEKELILERTLNGKREKARQGKIVGMNVPAYGFRYAEDGNSYEIDPGTMQVVRRIFQLVADGESIYSIINAFNAEGIRPPLSNHRQKSENWNRAFIRNLIQNDLYRPHTYSELQRLVQDGNLAPDVLGRLDADRRYGIYWAGRRHTQAVWKGREKTKRTVQRPRKDWIAIPTPDSGIPRPIVDRARERLNENRPLSSTSHRDFWELSGGIVRCSECGRAMNARTMKSKGREYYYYQCRSGFREDGPACSNRRNYPAANLEFQVADWISELLADQGGLIRAIDAALQIPDTAEQDAAAIRSHLAELETERDGYIRQNARNVITDAELDSYLEDVSDRRRKVEDRLNNLTEGLSRIERLRQHKAQLLREYDDWALRGLSPQDRNATYRRLGIKVFIGDGMTAELDGVTVRWQPTIIKLPDGTTVIVEGVVPSESRRSAASVPIGDP
jgi:site-specific DNA recombinase